MLLGSTFFTVKPIYYSFKDTKCLSILKCHTSVLKANVLWYQNVWCNSVLYNNILLGFAMWTDQLTNIQFMSENVT